MNNELTLRDVLAKLADRGLMKPLEGEATLNLVETKEAFGASLPGFVKFFIGISAWIAAILITVFLFTIEFIEDDSALVFGLIFCGIAIGLTYIRRGNIFWGQLSLALSLTGQILAFIGFGSSVSDDLPQMAIFAVVLETIIVALHRDAVIRFIGTLIAIAFVLAWVFDEDISVALHLLIFGLAVASLAFHILEFRLQPTALGEILLPVGSAITFSYLGILTIPLTDEFNLDWRITAIILFVLLLFLFSRIVLDLGYTLQNRVVIALIIGCTLLLIPALRMPGILAAIMVLVAGFWRNNRSLMGLAACFLVFYIWAYYYSLEWTLLVKSLILLATGIILLGVRYFVIRFTNQTGGDI